MTTGDFVNTRMSFCFLISCWKWCHIFYFGLSENLFGKRQEKLRIWHNLNCVFCFSVLFYYAVHLPYLEKKINYLDRPIMNIWHVNTSAPSPWIRLALMSIDGMRADQRQILILCVALETAPNHCFCNKARIHFILINPSVIRAPQICHKHVQHNWKHMKQYLQITDKALLLS